MIRSFSIQNFGCRVNQAEAFSWADRLEGAGLNFEEDPGRSDVVLVNTCTLTARADRDVRKFVRKTARENPAVRIVLTGCYAERSAGELNGLPRILWVIPNRDKDTVPERIVSLAEEGEDRGRTSDRAERGADRPGQDVPRPWRSRALVKIQDGCDSRCTFCVIPGVRGRSRSVDKGEILARIRDLVGRGYREIVLAGIHLSSYGEDMVPEGSLLALLREIEAVPGLGRIRLSSLDPRRIDGDLIAHLAGNPKICQHFHLSLQHASGRILERMGRPVAGGLYEELLGGLRAGSPGAALGADLIAGFPGEIEEDFEDLRAFLERSPLTYAHVFSYSARAGTSAAGLAQTPERIRKERSAELRRLSAKKNLVFRRSLEGRELEAVVVREIATERTSELLTGNFVKVKVRECPVSEREFVPVRIIRALPARTEGEIVGASNGGGP